MGRMRKNRIELAAETLELARVSRRAAVLAECCRRWAQVGVALVNAFRPDSYLCVFR